MTDLPAGLREALTEAAVPILLAEADRRAWSKKDWEAGVAHYHWRSVAEGVLDAMLPSLVSWLADHDAEVRQQGRNEERAAIVAYVRNESARIDAAVIGGHYYRDDRLDRAQALEIAADEIEEGVHVVARGGSDLKGQDDG